MPDQVSSNPSISPNFDPYSDDEGKVSRADAPNSSQPPPQPAAPSEPLACAPSSVPQLVASVPTRPSVLPPTSSSPLAPPANNNAQRTTERPGATPYASSGKTGAGDAVYAAAALIKGHDSSGADIEVLSASGQLGAQNEVQLGFQRVAGASGLLSGSVEAFTLRANLGKHNDDGSTGLNFGASATAIGFEGTIGGATSLTYGLSAGFSAGASVGLRDSDGDGQPEVCGRLSVGPATFGFCVEHPL